MAISRAQMEEQVKGFEAGDLVTNDSAEIDQAQQDLFRNRLVMHSEVE